VLVRCVIRAALIAVESPENRLNLDSIKAGMLYELLGKGSHGPEERGCRHQLP
jgi:hypothetical protein